MRRPKNDPATSTVECPICRKQLKHGLTGLSSHVKYAHPAEEEPRAWRPDIVDASARWKAYQEAFPELWEHAKTKGPNAKLPPSFRQHGATPATPIASVRAPDHGVAPFIELPCPTCQGTGKLTYHR